MTLVAHTTSTNLVMRIPCTQKASLQDEARDEHYSIVARIALILELSHL
jgi:hypothetical protein